MTRPVTQHLDDEEFESLSSDIVPVLGPSGGLSPDRDRLRSHLATCGACEQKLEMYQAIYNMLKNLKGVKSDSPSTDCPDETLWLSIASGVLSPSDTYLAHAAECDRCRRRFKDAIEELSDAPNAEEEAVLAVLKSQTPEWTTRLAPILREASTEDQTRSLSRHKTRWSFFKPPVLVFASLLLVGTIGLVLRVRYRPSASADQLLAQAYSDDRTLEFRIPGAKYGPLHQQRGNGGSIVDRPKSLALAIESIQDGLSKNPNDPNLLDSKARVDLLDREPQDAIESLNKARESLPDSPEIMTDLATAYTMRAEQTNSDIDIGRALDLLGKVLARNPRDTVALFNHALAAESLHLNDVAMEDWTTYLNLENDPEWRKEGKAHLDRLRALPTKKDGSASDPGLDPVVNAGFEPRKAASLDELDLQDELHLMKAIGEWLPLSTRDHSTAKATANLEAVEHLAKTLSTRHQDEFLSDLIKSPPSPAWIGAVKELGRAANANLSGDLPEILTHSSESIRLFRSAGSAAGEAAATFEYISGVNRSQMADRCTRAAQSGLRLAELQRYPWLEANLLLEMSTCDFMTARQEAALDNARRARKIAIHSRYKILELEGDWILDGVATPWVATTNSWDRIQAGLDEFWRLPYPAFAGEGFYSDLGYAAQAEGLWHCAEAVFRESLAIHSIYGDRLVVAAGHQLLAKAAEAAGDASLADAEYRKASEMLQSLGRGSDQARLELNIERAAVEVKQNQLESASQALEEVAPHLSLISNHYARIPYLTARGELDMRTGNVKAAEEELLSAVRMIEQDEHSLLSETDLLSWHRDTSEAYRSLLRLYLEQDRLPSKAFALLEWYRADPLRIATSRPGRSAARSGARTFDTVEYLPSHLKTDPETGVLTWVSLPNALYIFFLDRDGLHTTSVTVDSEVLSSAIQKLVRLCSDPSSDPQALDHNARQLYEWLVQPEASHFDHIDKLIVEPDDSFWLIPFQVLKSKSGRYLGEFFPVVESPGIAYSQFLRAKKAISTESVVLSVGDPVLLGNAASRFAQLPAARQEAANIAGRFAHPFLLTGKQATLDGVAGLLPEADVFHFAGHAVSSSNETGLVLSSAGKNSDGASLLGERQIEHEDLDRLQLVILSACDTGVAEDGLVDPQSLVRVFLEQRVPDIVASKWKVDSRSSAVLMEATYNQLLRGEPIEKALSSSEQLLHSNPQTAHPYYWAAFSVFGR